MFYEFIILLLLNFYKLEMLRPRTPPLKTSKMQAALNSMESISASNNTNSISDNSNQLILNLSNNNNSNLTYIDPVLGETPNAALNAIEPDNVQSHVDGQS